ncbi:hypothetical protein ACFOWX_01285 [Sphingorhabdus arenilitoris]|uniref:Uncharacterized protein n=1 Tax=Sphingorhabdus arenilitoris TaxID=1490041 RepID=A0ABV8RFK2_9SPHN
MSSYIRMTAIAMTALIGSALIGSALVANQTTGADTTRDTDGAHIAKLSSTIPDIRVSETHVLPQNPDQSELDGFCSHYLTQDVSAYGEMVQKAGWLVTSEHQEGGLHFVSFSSALDPGTSGVCFGRNGNLAMFGDGKLLAIAYSARPDDLVIGSLDPLDQKPGEFYIGDGTGPYAPIAKMTVRGGISAITPLPAQESYCGGKAVIPNIYGKQIFDARKPLRSAGWRPNSSPDEGYGGTVTHLRKSVPEVDGCSGTGYGFCTYAYRKGKMTLGMTSVGEEYNIIGYSVDCGE